MMRRALVLMAAAALTSFPQSVSASYCNAKPLTVIVHQSGYIYFTAENLCANWCLITPSWSEAHKDRAFSLLTTAIAQNRFLTFFFPAGCVNQVIYTEPHLVAFPKQ